VQARPGIGPCGIKGDTKERRELMVSVTGGHGMYNGAESHKFNREGRGTQSSMEES